VASDRPGLLFQVGQIFVRHGVALQNAKVATIGERAEDVFYVTTQANQPLSPELGERLRTAMIEGISESSGSGNVAAASAATPSSRGPI
jgi:[protein-PII] uridylyltransferase